jgi:urease accessory protein UreE
MNLCIPRIDSTITKDYIYKKLCNLKAGKIEKITEIPLKNDSTHKRILFKITWQNNEMAKKLQDNLEKFNSINLVYDMPWYWKIVTTNQRV